MLQEPNDFERLIASLATAASKATAAALMPFDVTPFEFGILDWCHRRQANTVSELALAFLVDPSVISRNVSLLVDKGLISRRRTSNDRRRVLLRLTKKGSSLIQGLEEYTKSKHAFFVKDVSDREWAAFTATAHKILANLEDTAAFHTRSHN